MTSYFIKIISLPVPVRVSCIRLRTMPDNDICSYSCPKIQKIFLESVVSHFFRGCLVDARRFRLMTVHEYRANDERRAKGELKREDKIEKVD